MRRAPGLKRATTDDRRARTTSSDHRRTTLLRRQSDRAVAEVGLALLVGTIGVCSLRLVGLGRLPSGVEVPWWALAVAFGLTQVFTVNIGRGTETHSFSLSEIPLVVGFYLVSPLGVVAARVIGTAVALTAVRRQRPLKVAFNVSLSAAETAAGVMVFRGLIGTGAGTAAVDNPSTWKAAYGAALVASVIGAAGATLLTRLTSGQVDHGDVRRMFIEGTLVGQVANTSLALCAANMLSGSPVALIPLGCVITVLVLAYRGYASLGRRYENLQRLYAFTRETQRHADEDGAVTTMLDAARRLLGAERAELVLIAGDGAGPFVQTRVDAVSERMTEGPFPISELSPVWLAAARTGGGLMLPRTTADPSKRHWLAASGWRDGLAVPFRQEDGIIGIMALADRTTEGATFEPDDLALFSVLVNHAVVALENSRLLGRLQHEALHDALTGLPNRAFFRERVEAALRERTPDQKLAVMLMDLDRFKELNDTLGHHAGDQLLIEVGRRLDLRLPDGATVARLGGDEFAVVLPDVEDVNAAIAVARQLSTALHTPYELGEMTIDAGGSVGIALCPDHGVDASALLQRADIAMYAAKSSGLIEVYAPHRDENSPTRLALASELRTAVKERGLEVWYQPQADAHSGAITGVEALARWKHPQHGWVPPEEFIPVAERSGLIHQLTALVIEEAANQWKRWNEAGLDLEVAVNLSMRNLQDPDLVARIVDRLAEVDMPPAALTLEITESSVVSDPLRTLDTLTQLAESGFVLAVDDFGTGYSSLTYLRQLPVRQVKIDKSFVLGMGLDHGDEAIVRSVIDLGHNLGLAVVAEGVETAGAWRRLAAWGCESVQGFYLSEAVPAPALTDWVSQRWTVHGNLAPTGLAASALAPIRIPLAPAPLRKR